MADIRLLILSPEETLLDAAVDAVTLPGTVSPFEVLPGHAPIISSLEKGRITWRTGAEEGSLEIASGFVEVVDNQVLAAVEQ